MVRTTSSPPQGGAALLDRPPEAADMRVAKVDAIRRALADGSYDIDWRLDALLDELLADIWQRMRRDRSDRQGTDAPAVARQGERMAANNKTTGRDSLHIINPEPRPTGVNIVTLRPAAGKKKQGSARFGVVSPVPAREPTREQIAARAEAIWRRRGCIAGEDERNWYEAEAELRREIGVESRSP